MQRDLNRFSDDVYENKGPPNLVDYGTRTYMLDHDQLGRPLRTAAKNGDMQAVATAPTKLIVDSLLNEIQWTTS